MSICRISYRSASWKFCGSFSGASTSDRSGLMYHRLQISYEIRRNLSQETKDVLLEASVAFQSLPPVQWCKQLVNKSCYNAQNLIENSGLNGTALEQLGLYTWWKPSSWYRVLLESFHTHYELSWLTAIICVTVCIRITTFYLPALALWQKTRMKEHRRPIMKRLRNGIGSSLLYSSSAGLFLTQYFGIKKMAEVVYPDWTTSGILSFINLTLPDTSFILPSITAVCFAFTTKRWIKALQNQSTVSRWMFGMNSDNSVYPIAACTFLIASNVPSAICVYWITSSLLSALHATALNSSAVRTLLCLPSVQMDSAMLHRAELLNYVNEMRQRKAVKLLNAQKKTAKIGVETDQSKECSEDQVKDLEVMQIVQDSLFENSQTKPPSLLHSKVMKLMEEHKKEVERAFTAEKACKSKPVIRTNAQKLKVEKIVVGNN